MNQVCHISNYPETNFFEKLVYRWLFLNYQTDNRINFDPFWNWLGAFLESLQKIHVKNFNSTGMTGIFWSYVRNGKFVNILVKATLASFRQCCLYTIQLDGIRPCGHHHGYKQPLKVVIVTNKVAIENRAEKDSNETEENT